MAHIFQANRRLELEIGPYWSRHGCETPGQHDKHSSVSDKQDLSQHDYRVSGECFGGSQEQYR